MNSISFNIKRVKLYHKTPSSASFLAFLMSSHSTRPAEKGGISLATFQSTTFTPTSLLSSVQGLSNSEMLKLIGEYDHQVRLELVALVNDNCKDILEVSNVMKELSRKMVSLKEPLVLKYKSSASFSGFIDLLSVTIRNSDKLKGELVELEQTKYDMREISDIMSSLINTDLVLSQGGDLDPDSLAVLARELTRCYSMISALDSATAETGVSSATLRDIVPKIRMEHSRIKATRLRPRIENELLVCVSKLSDPSGNRQDLLQSIALLSTLVESRETFYAILRDNVIGDSIRWKQSEQFTVYLDRLDSTWMSESSLLSILSALDSSIFLNVLFRAFTDEIFHRIDRSTQVTLFVPTVGTLDAWFTNFSASESFIAKVSTPSKFVSDYRSKWKVQIYVSLSMKNFSHKILRVPFLDRPRLLLDESVATIPRLIGLGQGVLPRTVESMVELADAVTAGVEGDKQTQFSFYKDLAGTFGQLMSFFPLSVQPVFENEVKIFRKKCDEVILSVVSEISTPMSQTYDSVKQVSALYRVASNRGLPTRHSVYVDLAMKPLQNLRDSIADDHFKHLVESLVVSTALKSYMQSVTDLVKKEQARGGKDEVEKIIAQIRLDLSKTRELVTPTPEFLQFIDQF